MEIPNRIEFISYTSEYHDQVIDVLREFFQLETVCISTGINKNLEAQRDLEKFSSEIMEKANINVIAKDVVTNKVVGAALNLIQVNEHSTPYFEMFRNEKCRSENAKSLMDFMLIADAKVDLFDYFEADCLFEITFLSVLKAYGGKGIGLNLVKHSLEIATNLKNGKDVDKYLKNGGPLPQFASSLFTGRHSQAIGKKLGFEVVFEDSFSNYSYKGKTYSESVGEPTLTYHVAAKRL